MFVINNNLIIKRYACIKFACNFKLNYVFIKDFYIVFFFKNNQSDGWI